MASAPVTRGELEQRLISLREDVRLETRAMVEQARAEDRTITSELIAGVQASMASKTEIEATFRTFNEKLDKLVLTYETELDIIQDRAASAERESGRAAAGYEMIRDALDEKFEAAEAASTRRWTEMRTTSAAQFAEMQKTLQRFEGYERIARFGIRAMFALPFLRWGKVFVKWLAGIGGVLLVAVLTAVFVSQVLY